MKLLNFYSFIDKTEEAKMGGTYGTYEGEEKFSYLVVIQKFEG
jgi:hypothetical protein